MGKDNPKLRKNGGEGTFLGNALRTVVDISPELLSIVGTVVPGVEGLSSLIGKVMGDKDTPQATKEFIVEEINKDIAVEQEITKRWVSDNSSKDWLSRNVRPLVVINFTLLIDFVLIGSQFGRPIAEAYLPILMTMGVTAIGGYFTLREFGKSKHS
jgi:hypothetical protein